MKKIIYLFLCLASSTTGFSQQFNFHRSSVGTNAGVTLGFVDVPKQRLSPGGDFNYNYYVTPFMSVGIELQGGIIAGGNSTFASDDLSLLDGKPRSHLRQFKNSYKAASVSGKVQLGQFVDYQDSKFLKSIKGLYSGIGVGLVSNNMSEIIRVKPKVTPQDPVYVFPGKDQSINFLIPLSLGINYEIKDSYNETRYIIGLGYQSTLVFGEGLDGYNDDPKIFENNALDTYMMATIGIKYCFGPLHAFYRR